MAQTWASRNHPAYLMASLFLLVLLQPVFHAMPFANVALSGLISLVLLSAGLSVLRSRRELIAICCLAAPCIVLNWVTRLTDPGQVTLILRAAFMIAFGLALVVLLLGNVLTAPRVTTNTLYRAVSAYMLIGISWATMYELLTLLEPNAIRGMPTGPVWGDYVYFSFTVLTTLGFGDTVPVTPFVRSLTIVEAIVGPLYLAVLLARLVALHTIAPPDKPD